MAEETAEQEDRSKHKNGKNALTIFEDGEEHAEDGCDTLISDGTYGWKEFEDEVIEEKFRVIYDFFEQCDEHGKSLMYRMLELIRAGAEKIEFARLVYLLARLSPQDGESGIKNELYRRFSHKMYEWMSEPDRKQKEKNCRQLKTAMQLYTYLIREGTEDEDYR